VWLAPDQTNKRVVLSVPVVAKTQDQIDADAAKVISGFLKAYRAAVEKEQDRGSLLTSTTQRKRIVQETIRDAAGALAN
jgi:uncharacterized protein (DUF2252 family)